MPNNRSTNDFLEKFKEHNNITTPEQKISEKQMTDFLADLIGDRELSETDKQMLGFICGTDIATQAAKIANEKGSSPASSSGRFSP